MKLLCFEAMKVLKMFVMVLKKKAVSRYLKKASMKGVKEGIKGT